MPQLRPLDLVLLPHVPRGHRGHKLVPRPPARPRRPPGAAAPPARGGPAAPAAAASRGAPSAAAPPATAAAARRRAGAVVGGAAAEASGEAVVHLRVGAEEAKNNKEMFQVLRKKSWFACMYVYTRRGGVLACAYAGGLSMATYGNQG